MEFPVAPNLGIYGAERVGTLAVYTGVYTVAWEGGRQRRGVNMVQLHR